jgi:AcrR family transcriptional regulator
MPSGDLQTIDQAMTATPVRDGRSRRRERSRERALEAARAAMRAGEFRPSVVAVAQSARMSVRTVFDHFGTVEDLHRAALDENTRAAIAALIVRTVDLMAEDRRRIVDAAVFGRV